jgi:hypothetical protein
MKTAGAGMETMAAVFGIAGAVLLATAVHPGLGFAAFLVSNVAGLAFTGRHRHWRLFAQQAVFLVTSLIGLWTWWLAPWVAR